MSAAAEVTAREVSDSTAKAAPTKYANTDGEPRNYVTDETLAHLRQHYRGWDFHALHAEFRSWIRGAAEREPERYQSAFIGFVKRYHEKNRHQLRLG